MVRLLLRGAQSSSAADLGCHSCGGLTGERADSTSWAAALSCVSSGTCDHSSEPACSSLGLSKMPTATRPRHPPAFIFTPELTLVCVPLQVPSLGAGTAVEAVLCQRAACRQQWGTKSSPHSAIQAACLGWHLPPGAHFLLYTCVSCGLLLAASVPVSGGCASHSFPWHRVSSTFICDLSSHLWTFTCTPTWTPHVITTTSGLAGALAAHSSDPLP